MYVWSDSHTCMCISINLRPPYPLSHTRMCTCTEVYPHMLRHACTRNGKIKNGFNSPPCKVTFSTFKVESSLLVLRSLWAHLVVGKWGISVWKKCLNYVICLPKCACIWCKEENDLSMSANCFYYEGLKTLQPKGYWGSCLTYHQWA